MTRCRRHALTSCEECHPPPVSAPMLTLPWDYVAHDNHRLLPSRGRLIANPAYRLCKAGAEVLLKKQWRRPMLVGQVQLHAIAFFPDNRKRDAGNYRKLITDALSGIAYDDDAQLWRETWERGGVDKANPRIEITLAVMAGN